MGSLSSFTRRGSGLRFTPAHKMCQGSLRRAARLGRTAAPPDLLRNHKIAPPSGAGRHPPALNGGDICLRASSATRIGWRDRFWSSYFVAIFGAVRTAHTAAGRPCCLDGQLFVASYSRTNRDRCGRHCCRSSHRCCPNRHCCPNSADQDADAAAGAACPACCRS